jgi:hypothetical protein
VLHLQQLTLLLKFDAPDLFRGMLNKVIRNLHGEPFSPPIGPLSFRVLPKCRQSHERCLAQCSRRQAVVFMLELRAWNILEKAKSSKSTTRMATDTCRVRFWMEAAVIAVNVMYVKSTVRLIS